MRRRVKASASETGQHPISLDGKRCFAGKTSMQRPNTLLFILALVVLALFLPDGCIPFIVGTLWKITKVVLVVLANIIIVAYFRKKN